jgi:hypothetical protein
MDRCSEWRLEPPAKRALTRASNALAPAALSEWTGLSGPHAP